MASTRASRLFSRTSSMTRKSRIAESPRPESIMSTNTSELDLFTKFDFDIDDEVDVYTPDEPLFHDAFLPPMERDTHLFKPANRDAMSWSREHVPWLPKIVPPPTIYESDRDTESGEADEDDSSVYDDAEFDLESESESEYDSDESSVSSVAYSVSIYSVGKPKVVEFINGRISQPSSPTASEYAPSSHNRMSSISTVETPQLSQRDSFSEPSTAPSSISEKAEAVPSYLSQLTCNEKVSNSAFDLDAYLEQHYQTKSTGSSSPLYSVVEEEDERAFTAMEITFEKAKKSEISVRTKEVPPSPSDEVAVPKPLKVSHRKKNFSNMLRVK